MEKIKKINRDVYIGIGLILFSIFFLIESSKIHPGAAEFPRIILSVLIIMSGMLVINGILNIRNPERMKKSDKPVTFSQIKSPVILAFLALLYVVAIDLIGFFVATTIFIPLFMYFFGVKKPAYILIVIASIDFFIYILFVKLLNVYLP